MLDEGLLPAAVALVLAVELGHRHVRLVDDDEEVVREVVDQRRGGRPGRPAVDVAGVVLDAVAETHLAQHLEVVVGAHPQALGLEELAFGLQDLEAVGELGLDPDHGPGHPVVGGDVVRRREHHQLLELAEDLAGERVEAHESLHRVAEQLDPESALFVGREDVDGVAPHPELTPREAELVALVGHIDEAGQDGPLLVIVADLQAE